MAIQEGLAYWASVTSPNTKYDPVYTVDLVVDPEVADDFENRGFKVRSLIVNNEDVGRAITFKRKVNGKKGPRPAPLLYNKNKDEVDITVGNGSKVKVQYDEWEVTNSYGYFKGLDFQALQVLNLVSYKSEDGSEFESLEGGEEF
jgi:hypothetical protein|tara:strand:- start:577 stop:1011 length:435 start_codon:yes stop_codon:yes gene_type:complete